MTALNSTATTPRANFAPRRFDARTLDRVVGRGGRVTDTPDPIRYAAVFRRLYRKFGNAVRYGFMLPVNELLSGAVHHPTYHAARVPQMAPLLVLKSQDRLWAARAALFVRVEPDADSEELAIERKLIGFYADHGVEPLVLRPQLVDEGYLDTCDFARRLKRAVYAPCIVPPQPLPTPRRPRPNQLVAA